MSFAARPVEGRPAVRRTSTAAAPAGLRERGSARDRATGTAAAAAAAGLGRPGSAPAGIAVDRLFAEGVNAFARGRVDDAEQAFERAARIAGMSEEPEMRAVERAASERLRVLRVDASAIATEVARVKGAGARGNRALRRGDHCEALRQYDKALSQAAVLVWTCRKLGDTATENSIKRRMTTMLVNRAACHLSLQHFAAAEADSLAVLSAEPTHRVARDCMASVARRRQQETAGPDEASAEAKAAAKALHTPGSSRGGGAMPKPAPTKAAQPPQRRKPKGKTAIAEATVRAKAAGWASGAIQAEHADNSDRLLRARAQRLYAREEEAAQPSIELVDAGALMRSARQRSATRQRRRSFDLEADFDAG